MIDNKVLLNGKVYNVKLEKNDEHSFKAQNIAVMEAYAETENLNISYLEDIFLKNEVDFKDKDVDNMINIWCKAFNK